jgi:hypothetical protein
MTDHLLRPSKAELLEILYQHRLLSTAQVHEIAGLSSGLRQTQRLLADLTRRELVSSIDAQRPGPLGMLRLWYLSERGAVVVEGAPNRPEPRRRLLTQEIASGPLQAHTLAVNDVGIAFLRAARQRGDDFGAQSWRHEVLHQIWSGTKPSREVLIPDAVFQYWVHDPKPIIRYRFLELDRASMLVSDLATKLARYARLHSCWSEYWESGRRHRAELAQWPAQYRAFPQVMVVLANPDRANLERRRKSLLALCRSEPELEECPEISISIVVFGELMERGPFAPIFHSPRHERLVNWLGEESGDSTKRRAA